MILLEMLRARVTRVRLDAPPQVQPREVRQETRTLVGGPAVGAVVAAGNMWARRQAQQEVCRKEAKEQRKEPYIRDQSG